MWWYILSVIQVDFFLRYEYSECFIAEEHQSECGLIGLNID